MFPIIIIAIACFLSPESDPHYGFDPLTMQPRRLVFLSIDKEPYLRQEPADKARYLVDLPDGRKVLLDASGHFPEKTSE